MKKSCRRSHGILNSSGLLLLLTVAAAASLLAARAQYPQLKNPVESTEWVRLAMHNHIVANPACAWCGCRSNLNCHHILPTHECVLHADYQALTNETNFITLCRSDHLEHGHNGNWKLWNTHIRMDCARRWDDLWAIEKGKHP